MLTENQRYFGSVKWYNSKKGYGFITLDSGESGEVFLHKSQLQDSQVEHVRPGERLSFHVKQDQKGPAAVDLKPEEEVATEVSEIPADETAHAGFDGLGLLPCLLRALPPEYETPTPIQIQGIPIVLAGKDLLGCAQTGTGKTAAFALPILQRFVTQPAVVEKNRPPRALVLAPTRELAIQIGDNFTEYGKYTNLRNVVIFGGVGQAPQVKALQRGVDILVATPGRLQDLINQRYITLDHVEVLVLDEADRMLDMGFIHDVQRIIKMVPKNRQMLLFSATIPDEIKTLSNTFMHDPVAIDVSPNQKAVEIIAQSMYFVAKGNKQSLLEHLLQAPEITRALVFSRTKHGANKIAKHLVQVGINADAIHGNKSQTARQKALEDFRVGRIQVLVATDVAARGIDVDDISHVFQFDLPEVAEMYVHRIGRTARAGAPGTAIAFCDQEERWCLDAIERFINTQIPVNPDHPFKQEPIKVDVIVPGTGKSPTTRAPKPRSRNGNRSSQTSGGQKPRSRSSRQSSPKSNGRRPKPRSGDRYSRPHSPRPRTAM
jgi:ATP-dependent RNA helicase RhlE